MQTNANVRLAWLRHLMGLSVLGAAASLTMLLLTLAWSQLHGLGGGVEPSPAEALTAALTVLAAALATWFLSGVTLELLGALPGRVGELAQAASDRWTPALARRIVAVTVGTVLTGATLPGSAVAAPSAPGIAVSTSAEAPHPSGDRSVPPPADPTVTAPDPAFGPTLAGDQLGPIAPDPGFTPTRPRVRPQPTATLLSPQGVPAPDGIVVRRGDTLWNIAARALGPGASDAQIARAWPAWYAANREVIGDDPDLIAPGQVLRPPAVVAR